MYFIRIVNESLVLVVALISGICGYIYFNWFYRLLFFQTLIWFYLYIVSYVVTSLQRWQNINENNNWVINLNMFFETLILLIASYELSDKKRFWTYIGAMILFTIVFITDHINNSGKHFVLADITACVIFSALYTLFLYKVLHNTQPELANENVPLIVISTGLLIYYACSVPYIGVTNYIQTINSKLNEKLFECINNTLSNIRYFSLAIGFWLVRKNALKT